MDAEAGIDIPSMYHRPLATLSLFLQVATRTARHLGTSSFAVRGLVLVFNRALA